MSHNPQIELESKLTALYCVTMIQAKIHQLVQEGEHAQTQFRSNFEITNCCGFLEYKVKVIEI